VPFLTAENVDLLPNNSLVRFRGMVSAHGHGLTIHAFKSCMVIWLGFMAIWLACAMHVGSRHG
jgi:hypothetical protein